LPREKRKRREVDGKKKRGTKKRKEKKKRKRHKLQVPSRGPVKQSHTRISNKVISTAQQMVQNRVRRRKRTRKKRKVWPRETHVKAVEIIPQRR
jgi:hypothetical protein